MFSHVRLFSLDMVLPGIPQFNVRQAALSSSSTLCPHHCIRTRGNVGEKLRITFTKKSGQEVDRLEGKNKVKFPELATLPGSFDPPMSFTSGCPLPRGLKRQTSDRVEEKK